MKGDKKVIKYLNQVLRNELTAVNQYMLHSRMLEDWGLHRLGKHVFHESVDEMEHADELIKRVLFLEGLPNLQELNRLRIGENVKEIMECDLELEMEATPLLREVIDYCEEVKDYVSRELVEKILESEEEHIDWLETQLGLIDKMGIENYLHAGMGEAEEGG